MDKDSTAIQKKITAEVEQFKSAQKGNEFPFSLHKLSRTTVCYYHGQ